MAVHARQVKVGINKATSGSWGTGTADATAVGASDGHYVRDDLGLTLTMQQSFDESQGQNYIGSVQSANAEALQSAIPTWLHYQDTWMNVLWALTLGTGGTSPSQLGGSTAYTNTFEPATNKTGTYATIVQDKSTDIFEVPGAKFTGFELRTGEMGRMECDFQFMGDLVKEDSTINTATQVSALTFPTLGFRAFLDDATVRINSQSGGALSAGNAVEVRSVRIAFSQPLDTVQIAGQTTIIEPEEDAFPEITLELEFGRYDATSNAYFAGHRNTTAYKADVIFTGAAIGTLATTYGIAFNFPNLVVLPAPAFPVPGGAGQIVPTVSYRALSTTSAPTGMSATAPLRIITTGEMSGNPFA